MRISLQVAIPPAIEPVTLAQLKSHGRIDTDADDILLTAYATAAREWAENYMSRALINTGFVQSVSPSGAPARWGQIQLHEAIELRRSPIVSIDSVTHLDINGVQTAIPSAGYLLDPSAVPARLRLDYSTGLVPTSAPIERLRIAFTAGYSADGTLIPQSITLAILMAALFLYERRGDDGGEMPRAAEWLLAPYRIRYFGG